MFIRLEVNFCTTKNITSHYVNRSSVSSQDVGAVLDGIRFVTRRADGLLFFWLCFYFPLEAWDSAPLSFPGAKRLLCAAKTLVTGLQCARGIHAWCSLP